MILIYKKSHRPSYPMFIDHLERLSAPLFIFEGQKADANGNRAHRIVTVGPEKFYFDVQAYC